MSVLAEQRKETILDRLHQDGKVMVIPLSAQLDVSPETIRRDLVALEKEGKLKRVYGGAVKSSFINDEPPYAIRRNVQPEAKRRIGECAVQLIQDGSTIVIDVGTTTLELALAVHGKKRLTILTNSIPVATVLLEAISRGAFTGRVIMLGGEANPEQRSVTGTLCEQMMAQFRVDQAFLSVGGMSPEGGLTDFDPNEAALSRAFAGAAQQVVVLADHAKLGMTTFVRIMPLERADIVISSSEAPAEWAGELERGGVLWIDASRMNGSLD